MICGAIPPLHSKGTKMSKLSFLFITLISSCAMAQNVTVNVYNGRGFYDRYGFYDNNYSMSAPIYMPMPSYYYPINAYYNLMKREARHNNRVYVWTIRRQENLEARDRNRARIIARMED